jgi:hypothetical protein
VRELSTSIHKYGDVSETPPKARIFLTRFTAWTGFEQTGFTESCVSCSSCRRKYGIEFTNQGAKLPLSKAEPKLQHSMDMLAIPA